MAAASMSMAVATARLVGVSARAETALTRSGAAVSLAAPVAGSPAVSCVFSEFAAVRRNGMNVAIVARAAEVFGDVATEEVHGESATEEVPEVLGDVATEEVAEVPGVVATEEVAEVPGVVATEEVAEVPGVVATDEVAEVRHEEQQVTKLYVGNLPFSWDSQRLAELCLEHGDVEAVEVIYDQESGYSRGFAFVTMATHEDAQKVINKVDGTDIEGRTLRVNYPQSNRDKPRFEGFAGGERRRSPRGDDTNKLFVGNLSWGCDDVALHQLFSDYGKVLEARVVFDRESGRSRGFGFVTLTSASEVNAAKANLDGVDFDGRPLRVNLAGEKPPPRQF